MSMTDVQLMTPVAPAPEAPRSRLCAYLVLGFIAEAVVGKFRFNGVALVPQSVHLLLTACLSAGLVALAASRRVIGGVALPLGDAVRPVRACVLAMVAWGFLSSVAQVRFMAGNFAFWAVWAVHLAALWWAAPRLLQWDGLEERLRVIGLVLGVTLALTIVTGPWVGFVRGRFGGPFGNPTTMARMAALALLFWSARFVSRRGKDAFSAAMVVAACVVLALTRTRASVAAAVVGVAASLVAAALSAGARTKVRAMRVAVTGVFCGSLLGVCLLMATSTGNLAQFMRLRESAGEIYSTARALNWQGGVARLGHVGFFGEGFLSKFDPNHAHVVMGITVPGYDWTSDRDPLNSVLGTCQQTGWIGGALFVCFLALLIWRSFGADPRVRPLLAGLCGAGLVWGLFDGNWLTSFGDPVDRISLAVFALLLSVPPPLPGPATERSDPRPI